VLGHALTRISDLATTLAAPSPKPSASQSLPHPELSCPEFDGGLEMFDFDKTLNALFIVSVNALVARNVTLSDPWKNIKSLLAYFPCFEKNRADLCAHHAVWVFVLPPPPPPPHQLLND
jgi:hypothetical protein